jgi:nucleoside-diphosphate-sugar epimerase
MQKCLVTGGAGFIGSNLVDSLVREGMQVRVLDNLSTGKLENLEPVRGQIDFNQGDVRDFDTLMRAMSDIELVFHQAAMVSVPESVEDPVEAAMINDLGTLYLLGFTSTSQKRRYGNQATEPLCSK